MADFQKLSEMWSKTSFFNEFGHKQSEEDKKALYIATKVYSIYLINIKNLNDKKSKEKKEQPLEKFDNDHSIFTYKHHKKISNHQKNKEFFRLTVGFKQNNSFQQVENIHKQEKIYQVERIKDSRLKEKRIEKKGKALKERKLYILNDSLKYIENYQKLKEDTLKTSLFLAKIKEELNTPSNSKAILKAG